MRKKWVVFVFQVKKLSEIRKIIKKNNFEIFLYCPMMRIKSLKKSGMIIDTIPMLFNYMFMHYDLSKYPYQFFYDYFDGCRPMLHCKKECFVSIQEIKRMKLTEKSLDYKFEMDQKESTFQGSKWIGKQITVRDGTFSGLSGIVIDAIRKKLIIELFIFNRPVKCSMDADYVSLSAK